VGFEVDKVALGQVFSPSTSFSPANLHSSNFSTITITYHLGLVQYASSGRSTQNPTTQIKKKMHRSHKEDCSCTVSFNTDMTTEVCWFTSK
jgi:hypothetical protein